MKIKVSVRAAVICCLAFLAGCESEQIRPVYEESAAETLTADQGLSTAETSGRKKSDLANSFTAPVSGTIEGRNFTGNFTVTEFTENDGVLHALGNLTAVKIKGKDHKYLEYLLELETYAVAVTIDGMAAMAEVDQMGAETFQVAATCTVLTLNFNGVNTNVLGLAVVIDPIGITINANDDEVLGNLICTVLDTLNNVVDLVGLLNQILDLVSL